MGEYFFFYKEFNPRFKPREYIQIRGKFYEIKECRPMLPWTLKLTNITSNTVLEDFRSQGFKAKNNEILDIRLRIDGPVKVLLRIEGAGGDVFGGWGAFERYADDTVSSNMLENLIMGDAIGWLWANIVPLVIPAWCRLRAEGYVYIVEEVTAKPQTYATPAYIASAYTATTLR
jgi:hypothetical protein